MGWLFNRKTLKTQIRLLVGIAKELGIDQRDIDDSAAYIGQMEYEVCFHQLINRIHEYDIEIDNDVYLLISDIATRMKLPIEEYVFMKELIRGDGQIPKPVKDELGKIIKSLK